MQVINKNSYFLQDSPPNSRLKLRGCGKTFLNKNAYGVILMHNHPSGNTNPSKADISQTESLKKALESLDIQLIDHIIFGEKDYYSFSEETINKYDS